MPAGLRRIWKIMKAVFYRESIVKYVLKPFNLLKGNAPWMIINE